MNIFQKVTLKNLKENRTRTLVTIIGIILSAAMFTAVTVSVSSLRHYLISYYVYTDGSWQGAMYDLTEEEVAKLLEDEEVTDLVSMNRLGFALLADCQNENKPYLCVYGIQSNFTDLMPVHLTEGRMPENSSEILLPAHLAANGGVVYELGDTLSLELGTRTYPDGSALDNHTAYFEMYSNEDVLDDVESDEEEYSGDADSSLTEQLTDLKSYTYTVVGFYERPSFEDYSAPGYTALTISDTAAAGSYDVYFCIKNGAKITQYLEERLSDFHYGVVYSMNSGLLRLYGYSGESSYNTVLYSLGAILIGIIVFGSISLIYNAFSISVSERTRQFGLLASIGATRKQLTGSVLFEAFFLSIIGIPLGILCGVIGIGVTFYFTGDMIAEYLYTDSGVTLSLYPSVSALFIAVLVSLITILISAWLPARRAMKGSAIEAIRQNKDIAIRSKKVKTSKLTLKLFGFQGMLAAKNYKRNRKKYRATVISLFLSIVLFISASSFCAYLTASATSVLSDLGYDISYWLSSDSNYPADELLEKLSGVSGVTDSSYFTFFWLEGTVNTSSLSTEYISYAKSLEEYTGQAYLGSEKTFMDFCFYFVDDETFLNYLAEHGLSKEDYFNPEQPTAVLQNQINFYDDYAEKYRSLSLLSSAADCDAVLYLARDIYGDDYWYDRDENGDVFYVYYTYISELYGDDTEEELIMSPEECCLMIPLSIGASLTDAPISYYTGYDGLTFYYPYSMMDAVFADLEDATYYFGLSFESTENQSISETASVRFTFSCTDHTQACTDMMQILSDSSLPTGALYDYAENDEASRAIIMVVNIFSYGFITLISLIAAANVFNTISTNILLRKREFAMLKSMGLDAAGFQKMMNFECLLYGFKGLLYGLPVSILITWLIYRAVCEGLEMSFFVPWYSVVIAVGSVFLVVFATMLYSMRKVKKENIIEGLKEENI